MCVTKDEAKLAGRGQVTEGLEYHPEGLNLILKLTGTLIKQLVDNDLICIQEEHL